MEVGGSYGRSVSRITGGGSSLEIWRRLRLDNTNFRNSVLAARLRTLLRAKGSQPQPHRQTTRASQQEA